MKKAIVLAMAITLLPLSFANAAPAADQTDSRKLRARLDAARTLKTAEMNAIALESRLLADATRTSQPRIQAEFRPTLRLADLCLPGKMVMNVLLPAERPGSKTPPVLALRGNPCRLTDGV